MFGAERSSRRGRRAAVARSLAATLLCTAQAALAQSARTQGPAGTNESAAEVLFLSGKRLMAAGSYSDACAKFAESERLDPAAGTLLNLGDCYEKNGQLASAWMTFREAATAAQRIDRPAWAEQAAARAQLLEPRLPTLTVEIDAIAAPAGTEVSLNGLPVARAAWGLPVPIDPPSARVEVQSPKKKVWAAVVLVDVMHPHAVVEVPPLEDLPRPPGRPQAEPAPDPKQWTGRNAFAASFFGVGIVGLGVAGGFAVAARGKEDQAEGESGLTQTNDSASAVREGNVATALAIGGGVFAMTGILLWVTMPATRIQVAASGHTVSLEGRF